MEQKKLSAEYAENFKQKPIPWQLGNLASELSRAQSWRQCGDHPREKAALDRAVELSCLTLESVQGESRRREISRLRSCLIDWQQGNGVDTALPAALVDYCTDFAILARS